MNRAPRPPEELMTHRIATLVVALGASILSAAAGAQPAAYPSQPIKIIVPFTPGGGTDLTARIVAEALTKSLNQSVVVENKPGAASQIGIDFVVKAKPDGYTLLWTSADGISVLPAVKSTIPYRIPESLEFVSSFASYPLIVGVNSKLPITDFKSLVAYAKANPGKLNYSSSGTGGGGHMLPAYMAKVLGLDMTHISYESAAPAVAAVAGGHTQMSFVAPSTVLPHIQSGSVRAVATTGRARTPLAPDLPTITELGYPQLTVDFFYGMFAPAGTPAPIVKKLRDAVAAVLHDPAIPARLRSQGLEPLDLDGLAFREFAVRDLNHWKEISRTIDFKLD
ncbi:MAG: tripartite tricarboxylate transporter substrate binding protein [Casimicrobiaceae bacterium]